MQQGKSSLSFVPPLWLVRSLKCHPRIHLHADISRSTSPNDTVAPRKLGFLIYSCFTVTHWFLRCVTKKTPKWGKLTINVLNRGALECVKGIYNKKNLLQKDRARASRVDVHHEYRWLEFAGLTGVLKWSAGSPFSHRSLVVQKGRLAHWEWHNPRFNVSFSSCFVSKVDQ